MSATIRNMNVNNELEALLCEPPQQRSEFFQRVNHCVALAHAQILALPRDLQKEAVDVWRARFHPWFLQAPCIERAYRKPLGYAGDFLIMEMGYRNQPEGASQIGGLLHQWFCNAYRGSAAVRSRRRRAVLEMERHAARSAGPWRALSLASGSSRELRDIVMESFLAERLHIRCLDQDLEALAFAKAQYGAVSRRCEREIAQVEFVQGSVRDLLKGGAREHGHRQFIYSLGLYDYIPQSAAQKLTRRLYDALAPGGRLMLANYAPGCDARPAIELIMDWHLIYRTRAEMLKLADHVPAAARVRVEEDETGTLWYLFIERPGPT